MAIDGIFFSFQYNKIGIKEMNRSFCLKTIFVAKFTFFQRLMQIL